jgi:hypothetical protein
VGTSNVKFFVELAGAGAVLVGLIFVGLELRQNTAAVEASTLQNLTDASTEFVTNIGSDPNLTRIWITSSSDREKLTETEYAQLHLLIRGQWFRFQNAYLQWQRGTLSDEDWVLYEGFKRERYTVYNLGRSQGCTAGPICKICRELPIC